MDDLCCKVPGLISEFVDALVDFRVGGQFLQKNDSIREQGLNQENPARSENGSGKEEPSGSFTRIPAAERLVAIGDIHGDLEKARQSLKIAGVIDEQDNWTGGKTTVVQVGDLLDRGGQELKIIYLLEKLKGQAQREGGNVFVMNGNHEIMNMGGDFRFVTKEGLEEFQEWGRWFKMGQVLKERCEGLGSQPNLYRNIRTNIPEGVRARVAALRPGGPISARFLADHPTILVVGSTVFAHGGILPDHVNYGLDKINAEVKEWIQGGKGWKPPVHLRGKDAVVWARHYSLPAEAMCDCSLLQQALGGIQGANRMVVGHTIQAPWGINAACNNRVFRVDVGMSKGCGGFAPEVLEIRNDKEIRVLSTSSSPKELNENGALRGLKGLASMIA